MPLTIVPDVDHRGEDYELDADRASALWSMEERHFWHRARNDFILAALSRYLARPGASILEVGCGSGAVARALDRAGYAVTGVDTAEMLVRRAHQRVPGAHFVCAELSRLPPELRGPYDAIGFFDVLEHLDRPEDLIRESLAFARHGAIVIATVPALGRLYSVVDQVSGHKRRYEVGELAALLRGAGLERVHEHGTFRAFAPLIGARRRRAPTREPTSKDEARALLMRDFQVPPAWLNRAAGLVAALELRRFPGSEGAAGASLLAVGAVASDARA